MALTILEQATHLLPRHMVAQLSSAGELHGWREVDYSSVISLWTARLMTPALDTVQVLSGGVATQRNTLWSAPQGHASEGFASLPCPAIARPGFELPHLTVALNLPALVPANRAHFGLLHTALIKAGDLLAARSADNSLRTGLALYGLFESTQSSGLSEKPLQDAKQLSDMLSEIVSILNSPSVRPAELVLAPILSNVETWFGHNEGNRDLVIRPDTDLSNVKSLIDVARRYVDSVSLAITSESMVSSAKAVGADRIVFIEDFGRIAQAKSA